MRTSSGDEIGGPRLRGIPYFHRFYLKEPTTFSQLISEGKKIPSYLGVGSQRNITLLKWAETVLHNKGLPPEGGYCI